MLGGMPKSQEKIIVKTKWVCPNQNNEKGKSKRSSKKKKKRMKDKKSQTTDSDP